jgi:hypothetical protein
MRNRLTTVLMAAAVLTGCIYAAPGHLYPVRGPLAAQVPLPIYKLTLNGVLNAGNIRIVLPGNEVCSGPWSAVPQGDPSATSMSGEWDAVYGPGYFVAQVLGSHAFARSRLTGSKGTILDVQFYDPTPGDLAQVIGVATDNQGNVFKMTL